MTTGNALLTARKRSKGDSKCDVHMVEQLQWSKENESETKIMNKR